MSFEDSIRRAVRRGEEARDGQISDDLRGIIGRLLALLQRLLKREEDVQSMRMELSVIKNALSLADPKYTETPRLKPSFTLSEEEARSWDTAFLHKPLKPEARRFEPVGTDWRALLDESER